MIVGLVARSLLPELYHSFYQSVPLRPDLLVLRIASSAINAVTSSTKATRFIKTAVITLDSRDHVGLTTWIPLCDCGRDVPGLELYPRAAGRGPAGA